MSSKPIFELVDELPKSNMTVYLLQALDFVVPGQWQNLVGFENTIRVVTGESDQKLVQQIGERAIHLYNDKSQGYQRAMWLYQTVDNADHALGMAAMANKVGEQVKFLGFLDRITPKADTAQTIDLSLKLVVEIVAFCQVNGIPGDSIGDFVKALGDYSHESLMRMAALISVDGLIPLGTDFIQKVVDILGKLGPNDLEQNGTFQKLRGSIPGGNTAGQLGFIQQSFTSVKGWMEEFVRSRDLSREKLLASISRFVEVNEDRLDYLGAFLDMSTNYFEHTGTQSLARRLVQRAVNEI